MAVGFLISHLCFAPLEGASTETARKADLVLAYSLQGLADVDAKDAIAALRIYTSELAKSVGYAADSYLYDNLDRVIADIQMGKADLIALSAMEYLRIKGRAELELALGHVKGGKKSVKYLLITHQKNGYTHLESLREKRLLMSKGDSTAQMYLQTLLLRQKFGDLNTFFSAVDEKSKTSQVTLPVFFGQADACIITDVAFKTMVEMNPQLGRDLKVMASSPELTTHVTAFRKSLAEDIKEKTLDVGKMLKNSARGRQVLMLFKIEDLVPINEPDLESLRNLVGEYNQLRSYKK